MLEIMSEIVLIMSEVNKDDEKTENLKLISEIYAEIHLKVIINSYLYKIYDSSILVKLN